MNRRPVPHPRRRAIAASQRGVVLIIALVMLITITLAGIALFRQVGLGSVIVGNMAFKQAATSAADRGVEQARAWLTTPTLASIARLQGSSPSGLDGYYPASCYTSRDDWGTSGTDTSCPNRDTSANPPFDPLTYNWDASGASTLAGTDSAGNTVNFVTHRLCSMDGTVNEVREFASGVQAIQSCVLASGGRACLDQGLQFAANCFGQSVHPYYRVTSRVRGPRNTLSYVEVLLF